MVNELTKVKCFKAITQYQLKWITTTYNMPDFTYLTLMSIFPELTKDESLRILNHWLSVEQSQGINIFNKNLFNSDSNTDTILKLKKLISNLDQLENKLSSTKSVDNTQETLKIDVKEKAYEIRVLNNDGCYEFEIEIGEKHWFKDNKIQLSLEDAISLANNIIDISKKLK